MSQRIRTSDSTCPSLLGNLSVNISAQAIQSTWRQDVPLRLGRQACAEHDLYQQQDEQERRSIDSDIHLDYPILWTRERGPRKILFGENQTCGRILVRAGVPSRGPERKGASNEALTSASDEQRLELSSSLVAGLEMKWEIYSFLLAL